MEITTLVIYPKGNLTNRIMVMVSAVILARFQNIKVKMIWDYDIPYDNFFLGNIEVVPLTYFNQKKYIYNPNIDQRLLYNELIPDANADMYMIIESEEELVHNTMSTGMYALLRKKLLLSLLKENMSGNILGQINLVDFPKEMFCCVDGAPFDTNIKQFNIDMSIFDIRKPEVQSYIRTLIYSKALVLINTTDVLNEEFLQATKISTVPIVHTKPLKYESFVKNYCTDLCNYGLVINPDINKISLL